ncbi:SDR family oxidoreductase [Bacillus sp. CGMCC 1.16607]|uniref:SDR family oxidoreductase n=1 Tax=Bacillus sp. CGMCC 1.16607 TaxID=3351842 RepID=UPI003625BC9B
MNLFDLSGKTAIVTGGGRGLGLQIATGLAEAGANIVVCSRNIEACREVSQQINKLGVNSIACSCDISKREDIEKVMSETMKVFGKIDILVNNSGISWLAPTLDYPEDKWKKVLDINVNGTFLFSQAVAKEMAKQGHGKIINIASVAGYGGTDPDVMETIAYNTSKGAIITFTKDLAVKLARYGIQVNAIAPGYFPTKITKKILEDSKIDTLSQIPAKRYGNEKDLKGAAVFLASNASDYINGHVINVDGGIAATV